MTPEEKQELEELRRLEAAEEGKASEGQTPWQDAAAYGWADGAFGLASEEAAVKGTALKKLLELYAHFKNPKNPVPSVGSAVDDYYKARQVGDDMLAKAKKDQPLPYNLAGIASGVAATAPIPGGVVSQSGKLAFSAPKAAASGLGQGLAEGFGKSEGGLFNGQAGELAKDTVKTGVIGALTNLVLGKAADKVVNWSKATPRTNKLTEEVLEHVTAPQTKAAEKYAKQVSSVKKYTGAADDELAKFKLLMDSGVEEPLLRPGQELVEEAVSAGGNKVLTEGTLGALGLGGLGSFGGKGAMGMGLGALSGAANAARKDPAAKLWAMRQLNVAGRAGAEGLKGAAAAGAAPISNDELKQMVERYLADQKDNQQ